MPKLDTDYGSFKDLIAVSRVYTVPLYQRRYSWTTAKQVPELWGDIVRLYRERLAAGTVASSHFIGSIVIGETESKALGPGVCNIIDGQQRLTTLSLILAAVRDKLVDSDKARDEISNNYLWFPDSKDLRLVLSQADSITYTEIVRGEVISDRKSPVYKTYAFVQRQLQQDLADDSDVDEADATDETSGSDGTGEESSVDGTVDEEAETEDIELHESWDWQLLLKVLSADLELVSISGVPAERAYQIFATLNHGGLKLSQVDLIRNAVFMKLPTRNKEAYTKVWRPLEDRLGTKGLARFLHAWVIRRGHNVPQKDTYSSVLQELKVPVENRVYSLLEELAAESSIFELVNGSVSYEASKYAKQWGVPDEMMRSLKFLSMWGNVPAQPLLMEIVARWKAKQLAPAKATVLIRYVESLLVRRFIVQTPPNDLRSTLARLTTQVVDTKKDDFAKAVLTALKEETRRWPADDDVLDGMVTKPLYRPKNVRQTFLVLKRIAEYLEGKEAPHIELGTSSSRYSVEHILPQTTEGTTWLTDMDQWGDPEPSVTWNTRRHTAGNLTLTAYNSELSNKSFFEKKLWIEDKLRLQLSA